MFNLPLKTPFPFETYVDNNKSRKKKLQSQKALHSSHASQDLYSPRALYAMHTLRTPRLRSEYCHYLPFSSQQRLKRTGQIWKLCDIKMSIFSVNFQAVYTYLIPVQYT